MKKASGQVTFYHGTYLVNLPETSPAFMRAEFEKLLGYRVNRCGALQDEAHLAHLRRLVMQANNEAARNARAVSFGHPWTRIRLVVWRDCWALFQRPA